MTIFVLSAAFLAGLAFRELVRFVAWLGQVTETRRCDVCGRTVTS